MLNHEQWYKKCDEIRDRIKKTEKKLKMYKHHSCHNLGMYKGRLSAYEDCLDVLMSLPE